MKPGRALILVTFAAGALPAIAQPPIFDPHADAQNGVERVTTQPMTRGQCIQCHPQHGDAAAANPNVLFAADDNGLCFACHSQRPSMYPLRESDRIPTGSPDAGYFEANSGGERRPGLDLRGRWPGERTYRDPATTATGHYVSPHASDPDMTRRDPSGEGSCMNCHDPHGTPARDLLVATYGGISGHSATAAPAAYALCLRCHSDAGAPGMDVSNRTIADAYDSSVSGENAGHRIRKDPAIALSWPPHVQIGDKLACYDCHGVHGSAGNDGVRPNAYLISDQRSGWSGLDDTVNDPAQARRFCFGCHIPSDGTPGSQSVQGIVMNTLSSRAGHASSDLESCYACHGNDYTSPAAHNVHNPGPGQ
jgi:predicted CXXCH cytochrome family protein